ncbi:MAG TPA: hypothetical protein VGU45_02055 [Microvirga sp.]|jgi:hypothetical protein|nr:hypothetical protein [Microvirga sp.]
MTKRRDPGSPRAALSDLFTACGGVESAANFLGRSPFSLHKVSDPDEERDLGFRQVSQLTRTFRASAAAEHLAAQAGGIFLPLPDDSGSELADITGQALVEAAEAARAVLSAESASSEGGKQHTAAECRAILREFDDVLRLVGRARAIVAAEAEALDAERSSLRIAS